MEIILNWFVNGRWCAPEIWNSEVESEGKTTVMIYRQFFFHGATAPNGPGPPHFIEASRSHSDTTLGRTPLDEWPARRRDLCLTTHNTHKRQTSMPSVGFEPTIPASEQPQTYALDLAANGIGDILSVHREITSLIRCVLVFTEWFLCRSHWPCGPRRRSATARLLGSRVRIPLRVSMFVSCVCCVGSGLCVELITWSEESYRWYVLI
jgi:hypothetical protein